MIYIYLYTHASVYMSKWETYSGWVRRQSTHFNNSENGELDRIHGPCCVFTVLNASRPVPDGIGPAS